MANTSHNPSLHSASCYLQVGCLRLVVLGLGRQQLQLLLVVFIHLVGRPLDWLYFRHFLSSMANLSKASLKGHGFERVLGVTGLQNWTIGFDYFRMQGGFDWLGFVWIFDRS